MRLKVINNLLISHAFHRCNFRIPLDHVLCLKNKRWKQNDNRVFAEKLGRRNGLIVNGFFNAVGAFLEYLSKTIESPELLIGGRFLLGACMALATGLVPMYITELTPNSLRGAAGTLHMVWLLTTFWRTWKLIAVFRWLLHLAIAFPFLLECQKS